LIFNDLQRVWVDYAHHHRGRSLFTHPQKSFRECAFDTRRPCERKAYPEDREVLIFWHKLESASKRKDCDMQRRKEKHQNGGFHFFLFLRVERLGLFM
jgi:hypothetical protein